MPLLKHLLENLLLHKTRMIVKKHRPIVVAVTGSYGKTSVRNAIAMALGDSVRVRVASENYNNELGVPLSVLGASAPGRSPIAWLKLLFAADRLYLASKAPFDVLVLEYGADKPGDIGRLCDVAAPHVSVLTGISPIHLEFYPSIEALENEKATLLTRVHADGLAVVNADDTSALRLATRSKAKVLFYGFSEQANVQGTDLLFEPRLDGSFEPGEELATLSATIRDEHEEARLVLKNVVAPAQMSAALAAVAVAKYFKIPLKTAVQRLSALRPEPGRLQPIAGIKGSLILDDSYNAAPKAVHAALDVLEQFRLTGTGRRIAALGHMAELGNVNDEEHEAVGAHVARAEIDLLILGTERAEGIAKGAIASGFDERKIVRFTSSEEAGKWLDAEIHKGDIVLVKGAQSARMEKVSKSIMAEPERAEELLCRQYGKWIE